MSTKRQEIVATTAKLIHAKGYENTKLSDILEAAEIGKGQFYHYFSSKHELGLAVVDYFFESWHRLLVRNILESDKEPETKFSEMLEWVLNHKLNEIKQGCVFGNLAVEMSEHDEVFRKKVGTFFDTFQEKLKPVLSGMLKTPAAARPDEIDKLAQGIVAMLEGGFLLMKNRQDIEVLKNMIEMIRTVVYAFVQTHSARTSG